MIQFIQSYGVIIALVLMGVMHLGMMRGHKNTDGESGSMGCEMDHSDANQDSGKDAYESLRLENAKMKQELDNLKHRGVK